MVDREVVEQRLLELAEVILHDEPKAAEARKALLEIGEYLGISVKRETSAV